MLTQNVWVRQVSIMHSEVRGQLHHPHVKVLSVTSPWTFSCAVFDPNSPSTLQTTGPESLRVTLWMVKSTQLVLSPEQNAAENCSEDEVMPPGSWMVRTRSPWTVQVMAAHIPSTVALNRTSEPCRTVEFSGSSWNCPKTTEHEEITYQRMCRNSEIYYLVPSITEQCICW